MNFKRLKLAMMQHGVLLAWIISLIATLGSLYFSEVAGFVPCKLCWYQRILMYPLTIILGIAAFRNDRTISLYILPISVLGTILALYHYTLQRVPSLSFTPCAVDIPFPCNVEYINWVGFITIPFLSLIAFSLVSIFMFFIIQYQLNSRSAQHGNQLGSIY